MQSSEDILPFGGIKFSLLDISINRRLRIFRQLTITGKEITIADEKSALNISFYHLISVLKHNNEESNIEACLK